MTWMMAFKLISSFIMAYLISTFICVLLVRFNKKRQPQFEGYRDNKFYCTQCNHQLTMAETFYEVCPYCRKGY
jgi:cbb3-type cytochrome oxidase subunit 3